MGGTAMTDPMTPDDIENEFPAWEVWHGTDRRWHARIRGAVPPVMVADDHFDGLREEIVRKIGQLDPADYERLTSRRSS